MQGDQTIKVTDLKKVHDLSNKLDIPAYAFPLALGEDTLLPTTMGGQSTWSKQYPAKHKVVISHPGKGKILCRMRLLDVRATTLSTGSTRSVFNFKVDDIIVAYEVVAVGERSNDATLPDLKQGDLFAITDASFGVGFSPERFDVKYYYGEDEKYYIGRGFNLIWDTLPSYRLHKPKA